MFDESQDIASPVSPSATVDFDFCNFITKSIQSSLSRFVLLATVPLQATMSVGTSSWIKFTRAAVISAYADRHYSAGDGNGKDPQMTVTKTQDAGGLKNVVKGVCTSWLEYSQNYNKHWQI